MAYKYGWFKFNYRAIGINSIVSKFDGNAVNIGFTISVWSGRTVTPLVITGERDLAALNNLPTNLKIEGFINM